MGLKYVKLTNTQRKQLISIGKKLLSIQISKDKFEYKYPLHIDVNEYTNTLPDEEF